jgi:hypothetical protein
VGGIVWTVGLEANTKKVNFFRVTKCLGLVLMIEWYDKTKF